jgi:hypothetical protein
MTTIRLAGHCRQSSIPTGTTQIMCYNRHVVFTNVNFAGILNIIDADKIIFKNCTNLPTNISAITVEMVNCENIDSAITCRRIEANKCRGMHKLNLAPSGRLVGVNIYDCPDFSGIIYSLTATRISYYVENCPQFKRVVGLTCHSLSVNKCGLEIIDSTSKITVIHINKCKNLKEVSAQDCSDLQLRDNTIVGCSKNNPFTLSANSINLTNNTRINHAVLNCSYSIYFNGKTTNLKIRDTGSTETVRVYAPSLLRLDLGLKNRRLEQITIEAPKLNTLVAPKLSSASIHLDIGKMEVDIDTGTMRYFRYNGNSTANLLNVSSANRNAVVVKRSAGNPLFFMGGDSIGADYIRDYPEFCYKGKTKRKIELFLAA